MVRCLIEARLQIRSLYVSCSSVTIKLGLVAASSRTRLTMHEQLQGLQEGRERALGGNTAKEKPHQWKLERLAHEPLHVHRGLQMVAREKRKGIQEIQASICWDWDSQGLSFGIAVFEARGSGKPWLKGPPRPQLSIWLDIESRISPNSSTPLLNFLRVFEN